MKQEHKLKVTIDQYGTKTEYSTDAFESLEDMEEFFKNVLFILGYSKDLEVEILRRDSEE